MRKLRLALAMWLWPKDVRQGESFTITRHLAMDGSLKTDGSWVGATLRADKVEGDRIDFSELNKYAEPHHFRHVGYQLVPGKNCLVKPIAIPLIKQKAKQIYDAAKVASA